MEHELYFWKIYLEIVDYFQTTLSVRNGTEENCLTICISLSNQLAIITRN